MLRIKDWIASIALLGFFIAEPCIEFNTETHAPITRKAWEKSALAVMRISRARRAGDFWDHPDGLEPCADTIYSSGFGSSAVI